MKLSLISLILFGCLLGCGDASESNTETEETVESVPPPPKQKPAPPIPSDESSQDDCEVYSYWVNNCLVTKVYCNGELKDLDIKCRVDRKLFPWEYIPDPPPPWVKEK